MDWVSLVLQVLSSGLSVWESKEKRKYIEKLKRIEKDLYEEEAKPLDNRDQSVIDNLHFDLMLVARAFTQDAGSNSLDKS
jgi:hypothetical protein